MRLFDEKPDILARYQERYLHVLVDEFQDTNTVQYALISRLSAKSHNIFCVGDEDQSIYKWRGADFRNIQRFREQNPGLTQIVLEENYRSTQTILDAARGVIDKNKQRTRKNLFTQRSGGTAISVYEAYNQDDEAQYVVDTIRQLIKKEQFKLSDFAVFYRTNAQSRAIEDTFVRMGVPYRLVGGLRFYSRREIKDVLAYLRLVHNPHDAVSLARVINVPTRGIGAKTIETLDEVARQSGRTLYQLVSDLAHSDYAAARRFHQSPTIPARLRAVDRSVDRFAAAGAQRGRIDGSGAARFGLFQIRQRRHRRRPRSLGQHQGTAQRRVGLYGSVGR